jgi:hypothetical protein
MSTIVTRAGKGSPLTNTELDANFTNLNTDKLEKSGTNTADKITFNLTAGLTPTQGELTWDADTGTLSIGLNGGATVLSIGEDQIYRVINQTGASIPMGTLVMAFGTVGNSGAIKIKAWDGTQPSKTILGLTAAAIPTEALPSATGLGYVLAFGKLRGIQTNGGNYSETWVDGDIIYAGASGGLTKTIPAAPNTKTTVAIVIGAHASNGTLFIRPTYGSNLGEDELVQLTSLANNNVLQYNSTTARFENKTPANAGLVTLTGAQTIADVKTFSSTIGGSVSGNAATATALQTARSINGVSFNGTANISITQTKSTDNRTVIPTESSAGYSELLFTSWNNNNTSPYADALHFRTYNDGTGGADNLVMFSKSGIGMRIWQQTFGSASAYATFKDVAFTDSSITGNAATATALQTARTIGGVSFNGTANISLPGVDTAGTQNTTGTAANVTGTVAAANGGTGNTSYAIGDIIYASGATALSKLADVATGNALISGGVGVAPAWGKVGLTTHVSGTLAAGNGGTGNAFFAVSGPATSVKTYTLPNASTTILTTNAAVTVAQGGTGRTTLTANNLILGNGTTAVAFVAPGTTGNVLTSNGTTWTSAVSTAVSKNQAYFFASF